MPRSIIYETTFAKCISCSVFREIFGRKKPFVKSSLRIEKKIDVFLAAKNPRLRSKMTMDL